MLKGSRRHLFFASTINVLGRMCLLKVLWLARVLTWGSEIAENVNEQLARMKCLALVKNFSQQSKFSAVEKIYCCQLWDCFANSSKYVLKSPFFWSLHILQQPLNFHFKVAPKNVTFSVSKILASWERKVRVLWPEHFDLHQFGVFPLVRVTRSTCMTSL